MLRKNLTTIKGYTNGSLGTVVDIKSDCKGHFTKIMVAFDCDKNKVNPKPVSIERISADYEIRKNGESIFEEGLAYVSLSRANQLKNEILLVSDQVKLNVTKTYFKSTID